MVQVDRYTRQPTFCPSWWALTIAPARRAPRLSASDAADLSAQRQYPRPGDELILYCFHYDPESDRYGLLVMNLVRLGGVMTVLFIGGFIVLMRRRESRPRLGRA